jgi:hypothetical protein
MKLLVIPVVAALMLSGCAHYYVHPTKKTTAEFNKDEQECSRIGEATAKRNGTRPCDEAERCLFSKGWRRG